MLPNGLVSSLEGYRLGILEGTWCDISPYPGLVSLGVAGGVRL